MTLRIKSALCKYASRAQPHQKHYNKFFHSGLTHPSWLLLHKQRWRGGNAIARVPNKTTDASRLVGRSKLGSCLGKVPAHPNAQDFSALTRQLESLHACCVTVLEGLANNSTHAGASATFCHTPATRGLSF